MTDVVLEVEHLTRYDYSQPVSMAHHLATLQPLSDGRQTLLDYSLQIDPAPSSTSRTDGYGNRQCWFSLSVPHDHLEVRARSRVRLKSGATVDPGADADPNADLGAGSDPGAPVDPDRTPTCGAVAQALRYHPARAWQPAVEFTQPSPHVPRLPVLADFARPCLHPSRPLLQAALDLMEHIHREFAYVSRSTDIDTPLTQVLQQKAGVCQDFSHLMIGACRAMGLPARYVSGYLLTRPPEGQPALVGADASHAWVQVWCPKEPGSPEGRWFDLDPTNNLMPGLSHVRLAVGRDFSDVTPLRGVIRGGGRHSLSVAVTTRPACTETAHGQGFKR